MWRKHLRELRWIARHSLISHCDHSKANTKSQNKSVALGLERRTQIQQILRGDLGNENSLLNWKNLPYSIPNHSWMPSLLFQQTASPLILDLHSHSLESSIWPCSKGLMLSGVSVCARLLLPCQVSWVLSFGSFTLAFPPPSWSPGHELSELTISNMPASDFKGRVSYIWCCDFMWRLGIKESLVMSLWSQILLCSFSKS